ncbi:TerC family protein [Neoehrlichia mikurensis]|uniref:TerC family protein n=1 Tax=Neoehrlichia mikurensis TaxID=89586 RepID=A0A9Q9BRT3_9RICK|nr:TerC family protein [Neoehrlichia mikurensis]QXK91992.1 TerC family protein [Neoehrlichia mikurensis]QXK92449.1 TerC family protein [Neoehrlichia mikurensis]QXK93684.1 TerC family protein [Neoehrlichia mikurensis]UTO55345.1 TerC family protein [Neoehrlichia mikurensis]UTO56266.1 TerC family protein [Neoehrlichia mikurensis]
MLHDIIIEFFILFALEVILGIDNIIFISLVIAKLPYNLQNKIRILGLGIALIGRIVILLCASLLLSENKSFISIFNIKISYSNLLLITGGIFLLYKSIKEIYMEIYQHSIMSVKTPSNIKLNTFTAIIQIIILDLAFSIDSIISAIGITDKIFLIEIVIILSMITIVLLSKHIVIYINTYNNIKTIAITFIGILGVTLILHGLNIKISNNYLYSMLIFSLIIEIINILKKRISKSL